MSITSNSVSVCASYLILLLVICTLLPSCIFDAPPGIDPFVNSDPGPMTPDPDNRYNAIFRKACHNCYEMQYAESLGEALNHTNNIEIDFWETRDGFGGKKNGLWYVRHDPITAYASGNDNCCTNGPNGNNDLDACLRNVNAWSDAHPGHEVITIYIDKKDSWSAAPSNRDPEGMDDLLLEIFGNKLYVPSDLQAGFDSPRTAIANDGWPMMDDLREKVIVVLSGSNGLLNQYVNARLGNAALFVTVKAGNVGELSNPSNYSIENLSYVVFYNMSYATNDIQAASAARSLGAVSRTWGSPETDAAYQNAISKEVHVIALYGFREDGFNGGAMEGPF